MGKYLKKYWYLFIIIFIVVPFLTYILTVVPVFPSGGSNDWAGFWGGYLGAIVGGIGTVAGVFISIQFTKDNYKEDLEHRVLPYIALTTLNAETKVSPFNMKTKEDLNGKVSLDRYKEYALKNYYFIINDKEITVQSSLNDNQRILLENGGLLKITEEGVTFTRQYIVLSLPINLENVGNGAAINFRVSLRDEQTSFNKSKFTTAKHLKRGESFYINVYSDDIEKNLEDKTFFLSIIYQNIYGQNYMQEYEILGKNNCPKINLKFNQKKY